MIRDVAVHDGVPQRGDEVSQQHDPIMADRDRLATVGASDLACGSWTDPARSIKQSWEGEILGEAVFDAWAEILTDDEAMWRRFAELSHRRQADRTGRDPARHQHRPRADRGSRPPVRISDQARRTSAALDAVLHFVPGALEWILGAATVISDEDAWLADGLHRPRTGARG